MNPEDLALLPGEAWIVVSEMAHMDPGADPSLPPESPGDLLAIRLSDGMRRRLFPPAEEGVVTADHGVGSIHDAIRGESSCPGPPDPTAFMPHGLDVGRDASGQTLLAVVNHGGREAVEIFEVDFRRGPTLVWRGCVPMPEGLMMNDVAWLSGEGFVVTNFSPMLEGMGLRALWTGFEIMTGSDTGAVFRWLPGDGVVEIENSRGSAPNGVAVSSDGAQIFVAEWGANSIYRLQFEGDAPPTRDSVDLGHSPDNLTWTRDGRLLAAGQGGGLLEILGCNEVVEGGCDVEFGVYSIDPVSLEASQQFVGRGAASVALETGDEILVGSFVGDRIDRMPLPDRVRRAH
jgi:hypothetical protein